LSRYFQERRRADFLQLVQTALQAWGPAADAGEVAARVKIMRRAQMVPTDQIPADLHAAAILLVTAPQPPLWASPTAATEVHWWPPDCDDDTRVPACAPVIDEVMYRGVQMTRKREAVTCQGCIQIGAARARAGKG
jgi:hypothetical protein